VLFGLLVGQSGLNWVTLLDIESAQLFIDLALGLILFELGYLVPRSTPESSQSFVGRVCSFLDGGLPGIDPVSLLGLFYGLCVVCGSALCSHFARHHHRHL
jgi:hypothetical protein